MEIVAHCLWAAAAAKTAQRTTAARFSTAWTVWWSAFPDVLVFGPSVVAGLWLHFAVGAASTGDHAIPHVHIGLPLYPASHSLIPFLLVFGLTCLLTRRIVFSMLGWLLHILIDIPTHSFSYNATLFLWPVSDFRVDGIAWRTPWFWVATYAGLVLVYSIMWRKGWMTGRTAAQVGAASPHK